MKKKRNTKKSTTKQPETRHPITLPQELHALIIAEVANDYRPGHDLAKCALVCKKWLQEARRAFFLHHTMDLYVAAHKDDDPDKIILDLLYQNKPICTFWPYIRHVHVWGYPIHRGNFPGKALAKAPDAYIKVLSLCLSRASNLQTLWVDCMPYSDSLKDAISNLTATKTVTSIRIDHSYFPSQNEVDVFLGLFPQLIKCQLDSFWFDSIHRNLTPTYIFSPPPSLQFSIGMAVYDDPELGFILHRQWSITSLRLDLGSDPERMDFHLITYVLKYIGTPLKSLSLDLGNCCFRRLLPLSLSHNTSLESFHIRELAHFHSQWPDGTLHLSWLAPVLNTIESRGNFRDFKGFMACAESYRHGNEEKLRQWVTSFDWAPVEDAILDLGRFPSEPKLTLALVGGLKRNLRVLVLKDECMPRLAKAGRLLVANGLEGKAIPIEMLAH